MQTTGGTARVHAPDALSGRSIPSFGGASDARTGWGPARITPSGSHGSAARDLIDLAERMGIPTGEAIRRVLQHFEGERAGLPLRNRDESAAE
jgi:hypothetical protein